MGSCETCELCRGLRGHERIKSAMYDEFDAEYRRAVAEYERLSALFREVCWYNFETVCRHWREPWHESFDISVVELHGVRATTRDLRERVEFPSYYRGAIRDAPSLPPQIVLAEVRAAQDYAEYMEKQRRAPYDWAPGGVEYEKLLREGKGVAAFTKLRTKI